MADGIYSIDPEQADVVASGLAAMATPMGETATFIDVQKWSGADLGDLGWSAINLLRELEAELGGLGEMFRLRARLARLADNFSGDQYERELQFILDKFGQVSSDLDSSLRDDVHGDALDVDYWTSRAEALRNRVFIDQDKVYEFRTGEEGYQYIGEIIGPDGKQYTVVIPHVRDGETGLTYNYDFGQFADGGIDVLGGDSLGWVTTGVETMVGDFNGNIPAGDQAIIALGGLAGAPVGPAVNTRGGRTESAAVHANMRFDANGVPILNVDGSPGVPGNPQVPGDINQQENPTIQDWSFDLDGRGNSVANTSRVNNRGPLLADTPMTGVNVADAMSALIDNVHASQEAINSLNNEGTGVVTVRYMTVPGTEMNKAIVTGYNAVTDSQGNTQVGMGYGGWDDDGNFGIHEPINPRIADGYEFQGTAPVGSRTSATEFEVFNDRIDAD